MMMPVKIQRPLHECLSVDYYNMRTHLDGHALVSNSSNDAPGRRFVHDDNLLLS